MVDAPLSSRRGYAYSFGITFATSEDITNADVTWVLAAGDFRGAPIYLTKTKAANDGSVVVNRQDVNSPWLIIIKLDEADTAALGAGDYYHECRVVGSGLDHCPASGTYTIIDSPIT